MATTAITRRAFLGGSAAAAGAMTLGGCATNPVTGRRQLMLFSQADEIRIDRERSPHQISFDYGPLQDNALNRYIDATGKRLTPLTHRPDMPYSFRGVNAVNANAYAFPGGTIAVTRGLLLEMQDEAQLAALLGHEIGHVTARHSAAALSTATAAQLGVLLIGVAAVLYDEDYADLALGLGGAGAFLFLAKYSRDNEREADKLAIDYMTLAGYSPEGIVGLMDILRRLNQRRPSAIEVMFSTHPMSEDRYRDAVRRAQRMADTATDMKTGRERYMDHTVSIRQQREAIMAMQEGQTAMRKDEPDKANDRFVEALQRAPDDYTALLLMAKHRIATERFREALRYAATARDVYPEEPQAWHVRGIANLRAGYYENALSDFQHYESVLAGNPNTTFFKGNALERMQRRSEAIEHYQRYLQMAPQGEHAKYVRERLTEWNVSV